MTQTFKAVYYQITQEFDTLPQEEREFLYNRAQSLIDLFIERECFITHLPAYIYNMNATLKKYDMPPLRYHQNVQS